MASAWQSAMIALACRMATAANQFTARRIGENPRNLVFVWRALAGRSG